MNPAVRTFRNLVKDRASIDKECYPAFDELLSFSLERRYLSIPALADMMAIVPAVDGESLDLSQYLQKNVCLFKVDEIAFDVDEKCHLAGVESAVTSMRNCGYSLVFVVQGDLAKQAEERLERCPDDSQPCPRLHPQEKALRQHKNQNHYHPIAQIS